MKPLPPPDIPGATEAERMDFTVRALLATPKSAYLEEETRLKRQRNRKRRAKKTA